MVMYQLIPRMEFMFHNSYGTFELAVSIQTTLSLQIFCCFSTKLLNQGFLMIRLIMFFKELFF